MTAESIDYNGSYADPNHPNCQREIRVVGTTADVSGTDGNPGCPPDGSGDAWDLVGKVDGDTILVDFSPKGGPANLEGVYERSPIPGIRWPDGNLWSRESATSSTWTKTDGDSPRQPLMAMAGVGVAVVAILIMTARKARKGYSELKHNDSDSG